MSRLHETLRHGRIIAAGDLRRTVRMAIASKLQLLSYVLTAGVFGVVLGGGSYVFGRDLGFTGLPDGLASIGAVRSVVAILWLFMAVIVAARAVSTRGSLANDAGLLTVVPTRDAVVGVLLSESAVVAAYLLPMLMAAGAGYALATGSWTLAGAAPVVAAGLSVTAVAVGYPAGLGLRHIVTQIEFIARFKTLLVVAGFVAYMAVALYALDDVIAAIFAPIQRLPTGWFADLLFLGTEGLRADAQRAAGGVALVPVLGGLSAVVTTHIAGRHWFADPVLVGDEVSATTPTASHPHTERVEAGLRRLVGQGGAAVIVLSWKRAARAPRKLFYAVYPLFFVVGFIGDIVRTGTVPAPSAFFALLFVAWAGAVAFTLNPLGDQGAALPTTALSRIDGRSFVAAHVIAGAVVAIPLGTALTASLGLLSSLETAHTVAVVVATPVAVIASSLVAVGIGMAFPKYDAVNVTRSTKAVVPSFVAFALLTGYLLLSCLTGLIVYRPGLEAGLAGLLSWVLPFGLTVSASAIGLGARLTLALLSVAPIASAVFAVTRFDTFHMK